MTKFCMRKAFKYVTEKQTVSKKKKNSQKGVDQVFDFEMPFRKNSTAKTMNAQFLAKVFSNESFVAHYRSFLGNNYPIKDCFKEIIMDDNKAKIQYLSEMIEG